MTTNERAVHEAGLQASETILRLLGRNSKRMTRALACKHRWLHVRGGDHVRANLDLIDAMDECAEAENEATAANAWAIRAIGRMLHYDCGRVRFGIDRAIKDIEADHPHLTDLLTQMRALNARL